MRLPNQALVFDVVQDGERKALILPIEGYGLWGTLYGYLALAPDTRDDRRHHVLQPQGDPGPRRRGRQSALEGPLARPDGLQ